MRYSFLVKMGVKIVAGYGNLHNFKNIFESETLHGLQLRAPDSSYGVNVSDQQSVGSSPSSDTCPFFFLARHLTMMPHPLDESYIKADGPVCCVTHVNEPGALLEKAKGFAPVFLV